MKDFLCKDINGALKWALITLLSHCFQFYFRPFSKKELLCSLLILMLQIKTKLISLIVWVVLFSIYLTWCAMCLFDLCTLHSVSGPCPWSSLPPNHLTLWSQRLIQMDLQADKSYPAGTHWVLIEITALAPFLCHVQSCFASHNPDSNGGVFKAFILNLINKNVINR